MKARLPLLAFSMVIAPLAIAAPKPDAPPAPAKPAAPAEYPTEFRTDSGALVKRGMTAAEVSKLLGEPKEKRVLKTDGEVSEVWVYRTERVSSAPTSIHSDKIVTSDNGEGFTQQIDVPILRLEHTTAVEIRELLMFRGRLLNWKETRGVKRAVQ